MKLGIDLDNTIIDYGPIFQRLGRDAGMAKTEPQYARAALREHFAAQPQGNLAWTKLQARIYGQELVHAQPFTGVLSCLQWLQSAQVPVCIISHKSQFPALGPALSLHASAEAWLDAQGIACLVDAVFFEVTQADKLWRIQEQACTHFIDDLPSILADASFPKNTAGILFGHKRSTQHRWPSYATWDAMCEHLRSTCKTLVPSSHVQVAAHVAVEQVKPPASLPDEINAWLRDYGNQTLDGIRQLGGSGNNLVYRLSFSNQPPLVAKFYKADRSDRRDRLQHEWAFLSLIHGKTEFAVPKPMIKDDALGVGVYSLLEGKPLTRHSDISPDYWHQCLTFLKTIQSLKPTTAAQTLPYAAEACLSLQGYLADTQKRRDHWLDKAQRGVLDTASTAWIQNDLEAIYQQIAQACIASPDFKMRLPRDGQILSPSDFGLHNAIRMDDGRLGFVDFEYSGWDHPLKTLHDFLNQPRIPMEDSLKAPVRAAFCAQLELQDSLTLEPWIEALTRLKWCYIIMQHHGVNEAVKRLFASLRKFINNQAVLHIGQAATESHASECLLDK